MITYGVKYNLVSETVASVSFEDTVTTEYRLSETELASRLSVQWALVRGETNDLTDLVITSVKETE